MQYRTLWAFVSMVLLVTAGACGGGNSEAPGESTGPAETTTLPATLDPMVAGNIMGMVSFEGTPPEPEQIRMNSDPVCVKESSDTQTHYYVVGDSGSFGNVFVYIKEGLEGRSFPPPSDMVTLNQSGCRYQPHVFGVQVGQELVIVNNDPTLHNIHATPTTNEEFNTGQPIQGMEFKRTFASPEVMVPFKCDVHSWMNSYVGVLDHPYFAVTSDDGKFDLSSLPPGEYVVEAWHEMLGTQTQNVTVGEGETAELSFSFTGN